MPAESRAAPLGCRAAFQSVDHLPKRAADTPVGAEERPGWGGQFQVQRRDAVRLDPAAAQEHVGQHESLLGVVRIQARHPPAVRLLLPGDGPVDVVVHLSVVGLNLLRTQPLQRSAQGVPDGQAEQAPSGTFEAGRLNHRGKAPSGPAGVTTTSPGSAMIGYIYPRRRPKPMGFWLERPIAARVCRTPDTRGARSHLHLGRTGGVTKILRSLFDSSLGTGRDAWGRRALSEGLMDMGSGIAGRTAFPGPDDGRCAWRMPESIGRSTGYPATPNPVVDLNHFLGDLATVRARTSLRSGCAWPLACRWMGMRERGPSTVATEASTATAH